MSAIFKVKKKNTIDSFFQPKNNLINSPRAR